MAATPKNIVTKVHCPGCGVPLRVPPQATGLHARCPACQTVFRIPGTEELVEETISTWIEEDVDRLVREHERRLTEQATAAEEEARQAKQLAAGKRPTSKPAASRPVEPALEPPTVEPVAEEAPASAPLEPITLTPISPTETGGEQPAVTISAADTGDTDRPRLHVVKCASDGVLLAFEARWLEQEGFRASMPVRCPFSGKGGRDTLLARPLAFIDQSGALYRAARDLESRHEQHLGSQTPRELVRRFDAIKGLPRPYNLAMPYYVAPEFVKHSLVCHTQRRQDKDLCLVMIPDGQYALDWLGRVNSVCGPDYDTLEQEVLNLQGDIWRTLPQEVRARIGVWCDFQRRERFIAYLNDSDFGKSDAGLAGLVVTDRRLVFHKFHHNGSAPLNEEGVIVAQREGRGISLTLVTEGRNLKMTSVSAADLAILTKLLENTAIRVTPPAAASA